MENNEPLSITLGLLKNENINSIEDFENFLDRKEIYDQEIRRKYVNEYNSLLSTIDIMRDTLSIYQNITIPLSALRLPESLISLISSLEPFIVLKKIIEPFIFLKGILEPLKPLIPIFKWYKAIEDDYNEVKSKYITILIKSKTIFIHNLNIFKEDKHKLLIIFGQYYLFLSSIFENFTKQYLKIVKSKPISKKDRIYREELKKEMKKYCRIGKINFYRFYHFLYRIVDLIKHEDSMYYKRYDNFNLRDFLKEGNEMYMALKFYIKNALTFSFFFSIKVNYPD